MEASPHASIFDMNSLGFKTFDICLCNRPKTRGRVCVPDLGRSYTGVYPSCAQGLMVKYGIERGDRIILIRPEEPYSLST